MSAPAKFAPAFNLFSALSVPPLRTLQTFVRTAEDHFRPAQRFPHPSSLALPVVPDREAVVRPEVRATILREAGFGRTPTIVLGGLVPDASEQVFLLRRFLLRSGDVYYVQYPRLGFSLDAVCEQLGELIAELNANGQPPILFGVSFGAGVALEWLRRVRTRGEQPALAGVVVVSPVTCISDLIAPGPEKPTTLLGRALKPYLDGAGPASEAVVEKSRGLFVRMFEAGAQNKAVLRSLMTKGEADRLREAVMATIRGVSVAGARQRAEALASMIAPTNYFTPQLLPLCTAPTLILFAEREEQVLDRCAPVRLAFERAPRAYFAQGTARLVTAHPGSAPVQHASLIFHAFEFLSLLRPFYQGIRRRPLAFAA
jgi:pimeloyl-ACP methyl ester carboxylesterase